MNVAMSSGHLEPGLVFIQLCPDWRDSACPTKLRIDSIRQDPAISKRIQVEFVRRFTAKTDLPGKCTFSLESGWQHTMSMGEEAEAASGQVKDRKVRSDDWNGATALERYEALCAIEKYSANALRKMEQAGVSSPELMGRQVRNRVKLRMNNRGSVLTFTQLRCRSVLPCAPSESSWRCSTHSMRSTCLMQAAARFRLLSDPGEKPASWIQTHCIRRMETVTCREEEEEEEEEFPWRTTSLMARTLALPSNSPRFSTALMCCDSLSLSLSQSPPPPLSLPPSPAHIHTRRLQPNGVHYVCIATCVTCRLRCLGSRS